MILIHCDINNGKGFLADCPDGRMDRDKMRVMFAAIMPKVVGGMVMVMVIMMAMSTVRKMVITVMMLVTEMMIRLGGSRITVLGPEIVNVNVVNC